jgi:outer membrane murein-binding lipoprotein Lpp
MLPSFDLSAAQNASSDQKLDMLLAAVGALLEGQAKIEKLTSTVGTLEAKVASQEVTINNMQKEMKKMKEQLNDSDQQSRGQYIRLFNFPLAEDDNSADMGVESLRPCAEANHCCCQSQERDSYCPSVYQCYRRHLQSGEAYY